jgi:hypothetical protein
MRVAEAIANRAHSQGRTQVSGYLVAGFHLAYLVEDAAAEREGHQQPALLVSEPELANALLSAGCPAYAGSRVVVAGEATLTGCIAPYTGFSMFPAALDAITDVRMAVGSGEIALKLREPRFAVALNPVTALTVPQVRALHGILEPEQSYLELRSQLTDGGRHVIARALARAEVDDLTKRLSEVGLHSIFVDYDENL